LGESRRIHHSRGRKRDRTGEHLAISLDDRGERRERLLLLYLLIVLVVGVPGLLATFVIGRRSNRNPVGAFKSLAGSRFWTALGVLCVVTSIMLMSFYSVVGGWILRYFLESATGAYFADPETHFAAISYGAEAFGFQLAVLAATSLIVAAGIRRASRRRRR